jgi:hypothetical protein
MHISERQTWSEFVTISTMLIWTSITGLLQREALLRSRVCMVKVQSLQCLCGLQTHTPLRCSGIVVGRRVIIVRVLVVGWRL